MAVSNLSNRFLEMNGVLPKPTTPANKPGHPGVQTTAKSTPPITPVLNAVAQQVGQQDPSIPSIDPKPETVAEAQERLDRAVAGGSMRGIEYAAKKLQEAQERLDSQVEYSADRIEGLLDSKGKFQWVSRGEVIDAAKEMTQYDRETTNAIFNEIEARGLLDDFVDEMYDRNHVGGGIPGDQRRDFFDEFGAKLESGNLVALTEELKALDRSGHHITVRELSAAIAENAPDATRLAYVKKLADQAADYDIPDRAPVFEYFDIEGQAIARVIGGMEDTEHIEAALASLSDEQLEAVINSGMESVFDRTFVTRSEDFVALAEAVGRIDTGTGPRGVEQVQRFLDAGASSLEGNSLAAVTPDFKDAFGDVYVQHIENVVAANLRDNGAIPKELGTTIEQISKHVLFSNPPGSKQEAQAGAVANLISGWLNDAEAGRPTDTTNLGFLPTDKLGIANVAGQFLHHTVDGLETAIAEKQAGKEANAAAARFIVNVAFDLVPALDSAEKGVNTIFSEARGLSKREIFNNILNRGIDVNDHGFADFYDALRENIGSGSAIENGGINPDLLAIRRAFEDGLDGPS